MMQVNLARWWHKNLRRPYQLHKVSDHGNGAIVVLLHGIGRTGQVWQHVSQQLDSQAVRVIAYDLLGFGGSPKPDWLNYTVDDHAQSVIASLERLRPAVPVIIVGHSMGCLVAIRVARLRPDLVRHLVLFEMPLYEGLPQKRRYQLRLQAYFKFYDWVIRYQPEFGEQISRRAERLARKVIGVEITEATWQPFIRSLQHTVMKQTAPDDIKHSDMPMDVIYGSYDMFVIRGKPHKIFGSDSDLITAHTIRARHTISEKSSRFIVQRIMAAVNSEQNI